MESDQYSHLAESSKHKAHLAYRALELYLRRPGYTFAKSQDLVIREWDLDSEEAELVVAYYDDFHV
jgi:hypothetical protein